MFDFIAKIYSVISKFSSDFKNVLILVLFFLVSIFAYNGIGERIIDDIVKTTFETKIESDNYSMRMAPLINQQLYKILTNDSDACNVILLSYHNTQHSLQGFSYLYITGLAEEGRWDITEPYLDYWHEQSSINFGSELDRIHKAGYLRVDSIEQIKYEYPKIYFKIRNWNVKSLAFYPIEGATLPVGLIIVTYKEKKDYTLGYYNKVIAPATQSLSSLMDYMQYKEKLSKLDEN